MIPAARQSAAGRKLNVSKDPHSKSDETDRQGADDGHYGEASQLEQGFAALRELRESTRKEDLPARLKAMVERLRRQD